MRADKYSAEPRSQVFASRKIMHAKGGSSEKLSIRMRNPCNGQLIPIHVRLQFFDSSLRGPFAKNSVPLLKEPLRQLRDVFRMLNQVANPNSTHINSMFRLTRHKISDRANYKRLSHTVKPRHKDGPRFAAAPG